MAYTKKQIIQECNVIIESDHNVCFLSDIFTLSSFNKSTFYKHIVKDSDEYNDIKKALTSNKNRTKQLLRKKWFESKQPTLQLALYKLLADENEFKRISTNSMDINTENENIKKIFSETKIVLEGGASDQKSKAS